MPNVDKKISENKNKRRRKKIFSVMAVVVTIITTGILMKPAIALQEETFCGLEEHKHTDKCYEILLTSEASTEKASNKKTTNKETTNKETTKTGTKHTHTDECYTYVDDDDKEEQETAKTQQNHEHTDNCYKKENKLICGKEEIEAHEHTDDCYEIEKNLVCEDDSEEHEHTDSCYEETKNLVCGKDETEGHTHDDECYSEEEVLVCNEAENNDETEAREESKTNSPKKVLVCELSEETGEPEGYEEVSEEQTTETELETETETETETGERVLTCQKEEHKHTLQCYSNPDADVETDKDWEATLPKSDSYTGEVRHDTVEVAKSQLGYKESVKNYKVVDEDQKKGYTRYGQWYGEPYDDWNTMFISFCLHYGGATNIPMNNDCNSLLKDLSDLDLYRLASDGYVPQSGDLVFLDLDENDEVDWVGIISEVKENKNGDVTEIVTIQGDVEDRVDKVTYNIDDSRIIGYGLLDDTEVLDDDSLKKSNEKFELTAQTKSGITVTITGEQSALPYPAEEIELTAEDIVDDDVKDLVDDALDKEGFVADKTYQVDITLWHDKEEIEPTGQVKVTFSGIDIDTDDCELKVYHIEDENASATDIKTELNDSGDIVVNTEHFSTYVITGAVLNISDDGKLQGDISELTEMDGVYQLVDTAWTSNSIKVTGDTTLDLNGYGLYYKGTSYLFIVMEGATFTIVDSNEVRPARSQSGNSNIYGNNAQITHDVDNNVERLKYYVTESNASGIGTTETLYEYDLETQGVIVGDNENGCRGIVYVDTDSDFNLESGLLTIIHGDKRNRSSHIIMNYGIFNMSGGYVCGGIAPTWGSGVYNDNAIMNMTGGVIAANSGVLGGGVHVYDSTFNMSGGVITGNTASNGYDYTGGGGIYIDSDGILNLSGNAYVTNNTYSGNYSGDDGGYESFGGGGIASYQGTVNVSGGYVTGNYSTEAGGGMYIGFDGYSTNFKMNGGTVAGNCSGNQEGGGIRIASETDTSIGTDGRVYITNNLGGGGIFVNKDATLNLYSSLIAKNSAQGYGGGVASTPSGTVAILKAATAIYDNYSNDNNEGNRYKDYYCASGNGDNINTLVQGEMLGGGAANWAGESGGEEVMIHQNGYSVSKQICGLTASPDDAAKELAVNKANVFVTGNSTNGNGGGITASGSLVLNSESCDSQSYSLNAPLVISGTNTIDTTITNIDLSQFRFLLLNVEPVYADGKWTGYSDDNIIGQTTSDSDGSFTINADIAFNGSQQYTYYLIEDIGTEVNVIYDSTIYKISIQVIDEDESILGVPFRIQKVENVTSIIKSNTDDGEESLQSDVDYSVYPDIDSFMVAFNYATFENIVNKPINLELVITDSDTENGLSGAMFVLSTYNADENTALDIIGRGESDENGLVQFKDLFDGSIVQVQKETTYYLEEESPPNGYVKAGPWMVVVNDDASATVYKISNNNTSDETNTSKRQKAVARGTSITPEEEETKFALVFYTNNGIETYTLPSTGGSGTLQFTLGGMCLVTASTVLLLWYIVIVTKRRKGEKASS
jgi:LPXTG-motif cell wall-anchored protein